MQHYEAEVCEMEARLSRQPPSPGSVAFYGSSTIRLWEHLEMDFAGVRLVNLGFGGSTMTACSWFFWRLVQPVQPAALVLYAGDNDLGDGASPEQVLEQFRHLERQLEMTQPGTPLAFISIKPSPARWAIREHIERANNLIRQAVEARPGNVWVDVYSAMLDAVGEPRTELYLEDGLHLSDAGYRLWRECLQAQVPFLQPEVLPPRTRA
jgi:lysophospholipase L1-like esterase